MPKFLSALVECICISVSCPAAAQISTEVHLVKNKFLVGEPVFVVWEYKNVGSGGVPSRDSTHIVQNPAMRQFATLTAGEEGGEAAVARQAYCS